MIERMSFGTAQVARYVKLVLSDSKANTWWSIREFIVNK